jgi:EAL domain-containing protein (putative c-di-GMP-specific phosphodiesterase class I)
MIFTELGITHIDIHFQPIVSVKKKKIFGYEALLRGYKNSEYIAPNILFDEAKAAGLALELDRVARIESIKKFKEYYDKDNHVLLFLNFESSSINNSFKSEQYYFEEILTSLNIPPKNIVLEVKEDEVLCTDSLKKFTTYYREQGFNIAIDDFGTGDSQFDRLSIVKPDIVKIDKSLLRDIDSNDINAAILKAIADMCYKIGAIALSEGVEYESEVLKSLNFGIDLFQGYLFARPSLDAPDKDDLLEIMNIVGHKHRFYLESTIKIKRKSFLEASEISQNLISIIDDQEITQNQKVIEFVQGEKRIEALYLIDVDISKQIGDTLFMAEQKGFYMPSVHGEDHSLKEYFYICKDSKDGKFISPKYISSASGNVCRTFTQKFFHDSKELILCLDLYL